MAINPNNGVLDIINGTLKVTSIDIKQAAGFTTAINTVARNDVLLADDQKSTTTFTPTAPNGYMSSTGVTRDTTVGSGYLELGTASDGGWVYWPLQLPNSWHTEFDMHVTATGGVLTYSLFNTSEPNHTDYTNNDGGYKIVFDNTNNQIVIYWEGSIHKTVSATLRSNDWQHVNINYFQGAVSISLAGKVVLTHEFTENYQEFDSRYVGFSATAGTSHKIRHLRVHNSDKWLYTHTSNASDIAYVSGNVGIGSLAPTELLDVHGNVHIAKDLTVDGNLTVSGTTTFIDTANMSIEDPIIELAKGNASDTIDSGLVITRPTSNVTVAYRGDESELALGYTQSGASDTDVVPVADGGLDVRVYGNLFANNLTTTANVNATYVKGDGSELTGITLGSVIDYGNTSSNTIQLTNSDIGLVATGNIQANYFVGDGSRLTGLVTTLESVTDNGNTTSNTVQFTNSTTSLIASSNVGIGTSVPDADLHVVGYQYVNDPPTQSASFDHSDAPLTLTHTTPTSTTAIDDPKAVLHLTRDGTSGESYGAKASFKMSRYENSGAASRSRLDVTLADGTYADTSVMTVRSDGRVGINTTTPGYGLDVHGTANVGALTVTSVAGNGSALYGIQSSNVSDFASNVTRIENLESNLSANSLRIANLESSDMTITGEKTFSSNVEVGTGNLFVDTTTSNVGVNTTTPGYTLDVAGDINLSGDFYQGGSPFVSSLWTDGADALYYRSNVEVGTGNLFVDTTTSNVGIGKTTPGYTLDVAGDINLSGDFYQGGSPFVSSLWTDGADALYYRSNVEVGTGNLFVDTTQGYVGIGTTAPAYELDVIGNVYVSNNIYGNSLTINTVSITTTVGLDEVLNVSNTSSNTIQITNAAEAMSTTTGAITVTGGIGIGSNLYVGKDLTVDGNITINNVSLTSTIDFQEASNEGNTTTNTIEFNNPTTSLVAAGNVEVGGALTVTNILGTKVAIGTNAGATTQGDNTVAVGVSAGRTGQGIRSVATGYFAGESSQGDKAVAIGDSAGQTNQSTFAVAVGRESGRTSQGQNAVAVGNSAGLNSQGNNATAIGTYAGLTSQANECVAVGVSAGQTNQSIRAVAMGSSAGNTGQGANAIAIGHLAGQTNQHNNSIVLNASGSALNTAQASSFYVKPVRGGNFAASALAYTSAGEVVEETGMHFDASGNVGIGESSPSVALDVNGVISASGSTSGSAHSSSCILYLLDTPQINEWSWTGATNNTLRITYSNLPTGCKAVLADVFMPQHSNNDHVGHMLGKNYSQVGMWTGGRNVRPSSQFGNMAKQVIYFNMPGQSDGFEYYYGNWWPSQIIPLDTNNRMYHTVSGESSGTSSWMYVVTKGYYL